MRTVTLDAYVLESLVPDLAGHDRRPSSALVYLHLWMRCADARSRSVALSYADLAAETGLAKATVQAAIRHLRGRRLITVEQATPTATPVYAVLRPWVRRRSTE